MFTLMACCVRWKPELQKLAEDGRALEALNLELRADPELVVSSKLCWHLAFHLDTILRLGLGRLRSLPDT